VVVYIGGRASLWGGGAIAIPFVFAMEMVRSVFSDYLTGGKRLEASRK